MSAQTKKSPATAGLLARHAAALSYVCRVLLPVILRTGRRPVLFSRWTGMGDIICTIPAARELRKRHPGATFIYNCHPDFADVVRLAEIAGQTTALESIGIIGHWFGFLLGGFYHFTRGGDLPDSHSMEPMVMEFCRQFGLPATAEHPQLAISTAAQEKVRRLLAAKNLEAASLVLLHPGPSWKVREWPSEQWAQLVAALQQRGFTSIVQIGVARYQSASVGLQTVPGAVSLVDQLSIEECFAVIAQARLFIGIDSGLMHIAACTRTPTVGIWGPTLPQFVYRQESWRSSIQSLVDCAGCDNRKPRLHWFTNCPYDIKCMKAVSVPEVLRWCEVQLGTPAPG